MNRVKYGRTCFVSSGMMIGVKCREMCRVICGIKFCVKWYVVCIMMCNVMCGLKRGIKGSEVCAVKRGEMCGVVRCNLGCGSCCYVWDGV